MLFGIDLEVNLKKSVLLITSLFLMVSALSMGQDPNDDLLILPAQPLSAGGVKTRLHTLTGKVRFLGALEGRSIAQPSGLRVGATPEDRARHFLGSYGHLFGLEGASEELGLLRAKVLDNGRSVVRFQQYAQGLAVLGGQLIVNMDAAGNVLSVNGEVLPELQAFDAEPSISETEAMAAALAAVSEEYKVSSKQLTVTPPWQLDLQCRSRGRARPGVQHTGLVFRCRCGRTTRQCDGVGGREPG